MMFSKYRENFFDINYMLFRGDRVNENIIHEDYHANIQEFSQNIIHEVLKSSGSIRESKWHDIVLKVSKSTAPSSFPLITSFNPKKMVSIQ